MVNSPASEPPNAGSGGSSSSGLGAQAKGLADDARRSAEAFAEDRKAQSAERLQGVAETVSRVADDVAQESPAMGDFVRRAASGLDDVSRSLKDKSVGDLLDMAKGFARREPAAFLAASAVAGFALSRLLKSSAQPTVAASPSGAPGAPAPSGSGSTGAIPAPKPMQASSVRPADPSPAAKPSGAPSPVPSRLGTIGAEAPTSAGHGGAPAGGAKPAGSTPGAAPVVTKLGEKGDAI
jgi:hypothetical protein